MFNKNAKTVNCWWPRQPKPGNFGDILTPWLIKKISGYTATYVNYPYTTPMLMCIGSILNKANEFSTVWGSGAMKLTDKLSPLAKYKAVRGPISRQMVLDNGGMCPPVYGDPALLLPTLYAPQMQPKYDYGIFPHYVDYDQVLKWYDQTAGVKIINAINSDPLAVVNNMLQCKHIISSSLHGIIVAQAYGIPATWVRFSDKLYGDGTKFKDYFQSVEIDMQVTEFYERIDNNNFPKFKYTNDIKFDSIKLLEAFPHP